MGEPPGGRVRLHGESPATDTTGADAHYDRGCACLAAGALDEAVESFDRALALNDRDAQALFNRGYTRALQLQRFASVAVETVDGTRRTWREPAQEVLLDRAVADFTQALAIQPGMAKAHGMRAEMYWLRGQQDLAMADYRQAAHLGCDISARRLRERAGDG